MSLTHKWILRFSALLKFSCLMPYSTVLYGCCAATWTVLSTTTVFWFKQKHTSGDSVTGWLILCLPFCPMLGKVLHVWHRPFPFFVLLLDSWVCLSSGWCPHHLSGKTHIYTRVTLTSPAICFLWYCPHFHSECLSQAFCPIGWVLNNFKISHKPSELLGFIFPYLVQILVGFFSHSDGCFVSSC